MTAFLMVRRLRRLVCPGAALSHVPLVCVTRSRKFSAVITTERSLPSTQRQAKFSRFIVESVHDQPLAKATISLNGNRLEKWALKTFFNLGYIRGLNSSQPRRIDPPEHLVRHIFLDEPVADGVGLYFVTGKVSNNSESPAGLWWNQINDSKNVDDVSGMTFTFFGVRFVVSTLPVRAESRIVAMGELNGFDFSTAKVVYRPPGIGMTSSPAGLKQIELEW